MEEAKWYVAHTFSGYENKVASNIETVVENRNLHDWIQDVVVPTETVVEIKDDGTKKEVERKIFPGYVLIKMVMNDDSWYVVRNTRGCTGFVGPESKPVPLTEEEVRKLGVEKVTVEVHYAVGDLVNVIDGPLEGSPALWTPSTFPTTARRSPFPCLGAKHQLILSLTSLKRSKTNIW